MTATYAYHRRLLSALRRVDPNTICVAATKLWRPHGPRLKTVFVDAADSADTPWLERPEGRRLVSVVRPGDEVIVVWGGGIFTTYKNHASSVRNLWEKGVTLHIIGLDGKPILSTAEDGALVVQTLQNVAAFAASSRSEAIRVGILERKLQRRRHARYAGYGHKWQRGKRVVDSHEQFIISQIGRLRQEGRSWNEIATHLLYLGETTAAGAEWSPARVRRAWFAFQGR